MEILVCCCEKEKHKRVELFLSSPDITQNESIDADILFAYNKNLVVKSKKQLPLEN